MKSRREHAVVIFADLSFLLITVLISGYLFVSIKKENPLPGDVKNKRVLYEKEIEFADVDDTGSRAFTGNQDLVEVKVFREGGRFAINDKEVLKSEIESLLRDINGDAITVSIDRYAPSEDTLHLQSILRKLGLKGNYKHN